jgi:hypothetical protein
VSLIFAQLDTLQHTVAELAMPGATEDRTTDRYIPVSRAQRLRIRGREGLIRDDRDSRQPAVLTRPRGVFPQVKCPLVPVPPSLSRRDGWSTDVLQGRDGWIVHKSPSDTMG